MRSTGEVMGIDSTVGTAFYKAETAAGTRLPTSGMVCLSFAACDRRAGRGEGVPKRVRDGGLHGGDRGRHAAADVRDGAPAPPRPRHAGRSRRGEAVSGARTRSSRDAFFFLMTRPPPSSALFPYTTLFRSAPCHATRHERADAIGRVERSPECHW